MGGEVKEECGVAAIYLKDLSKQHLLPSLLLQMGYMLRHRGQKAAGICIYNPSSQRALSVYKGVGTVSNVFGFDARDKFDFIVREHPGVAGIFHNRYSTSGSKNPKELEDEAQPFLRRHGRVWKKFALAFNGNIANYTELKDSLPKDYSLDTTVDTEIIMHLISLELNRRGRSESGGSQKPNLFDVFSSVAPKLDGAYCLASLFADGDLIVMRDSNGIRPFYYGENETFFAAASETIALKSAGLEHITEVPRGTILNFNLFGLESRIFSSRPESFCHFEFVYFSDGGSEYNQTSVREIRKLLGRKLAEKERLDFPDKSLWLVVPAPKTAIPAAEEYAHVLGLRFSMSIDKVDRRIFINDLAERENLMGRAYKVYPDVFGRNVVLIDDSIVRGETSRRLVKLLHDAGAKEVHLRSTEPQITFPCFYGIDFPTKNELISRQFPDVESLAKALGASSVSFQTLPDLKSVLAEKDLCVACLTGEYPTEFGRIRESELK